MPIKRPPALIPFSQLTGTDLETHQHYNRVTDDKGRYLPFDEFCRRTSSGKMSLSHGRLRSARGTQPYNGSIIATKQAIRLALSLHLTSCQCVNWWTSTPQGWRSKNLPPDSGAGKELTALSMEEPITSSQLEGANTTTLVARDMLESGRAPVPKMNT